MEYGYKEAAAYIEEIPKFTKKHTIEHTKEFLRRLHNPEAGKKIIHVAGTNGKGSVCAYMKAILLAEEKHTGFFTSPHLIALNERIQVDQRQVDDDEFLRAFLKVKQVVDEMDSEGIAHPSYFEFLFGMGMVVFAETGMEYIILETGLGGRLDATNSVEYPLVTVITSISMDHTEHLGDTIEKIAFEKAGIIKEQVPVICDASNEKALEIIRRQALHMHADCREISKNAFEIREITDKHIAFSRVNAYDEDVTWTVAGAGLYQVMNASLAIEAMEYALHGEAVHKDRWKEALMAVKWEGRMEEVLPQVFIDGAHNPGAVEAFVESAAYMEAAKSAEEKGEKALPVLLFSAAADKEYEQMIAYLCENLPAKEYIVTEIEDQRKVPAAKLEQVFKAHTSQKVTAISDAGEALELALTEKEEDGRVYCLGSLYLAGTIKEYLNRRQTHA